MRVPRLVLLGLVPLGAMAMLAGCGSGASYTPTPSSASPAVQVTAKDFSFTPATLTAKAGQKVTVTVRNTGSVEHNFSITSLRVNLDIAKGATETVTFTPTQAGGVQFFCEYHKDSNNMVGTLTGSS